MSSYILICNDTYIIQMCKLHICNFCYINHVWFKAMSKRMNNKKKKIIESTHISITYVFSFL